MKNKFDTLLGFEDYEDKIEHESKVLMFKFLDHVEKEMQLRNMTKKDLATTLGSSASFVTQLFRGTKTINLLTLAKLQEIFDIEFQISTVMKVKPVMERKTKKKSGYKEKKVQL